PQDVAMWRDITRRIYDRLPPLAAIPFDGWFDALYRRFGDPEAWRFYDDVEKVLVDLRARGLQLGIISNWDTRLKSICDGLGPTRPREKPDPRLPRVTPFPATAHPFVNPPRESSSSTPRRASPPRATGCCSSPATGARRGRRTRSRIFFPRR